MGRLYAPSTWRLIVSRTCGWLVTLAVALLILAASSAVVRAADAEGTKSPPEQAYTLRDELLDGLDATYRGLVWETIQRSSNTSQNPDNSFARLPGSLLTGELRPDFSLDYRTFAFSIKPRARFDGQKVHQGDAEGETGTETELFINEWLMRVQLSERLLTSYGRENLQWGPSFLTSSSNPFFNDNGRLRLNTEVRGRDFARLVWLPSESWTISAIANTGAGASTAGESFDEIFSLKVDWVGESSYAGVIGSHKKGTGSQLGGYVGVTASDALLTYIEGRVQKGSEALYPTQSTNPFGLTMAATKSDDSDLKTIGLFGLSYTLESGPTLTLEYLYNGQGYTSSEARVYYDLRQQASDAFTAGGPNTGLAAQILGATVSPGLSFLRRHYLMLQYVHSDIGDSLSLTGRWLLNLEEGSSQLYGSVVYSLGDHVELFTTGILTSTQPDTEFGSMLSYQCTLGLTYVF